MSLSVQITSFADPIPFEIVEVPEPHPAPGEVRVRVHGAGLNPVDWKVVANPEYAARFGVTLPVGFGTDFAGVVDEVGDGVEGFVLGDRVFGGLRGHAVAEHVVISADGDLWKTPDGLDDTLAGALFVVGRTADAVIARAGVDSGDTVLIGAAAGGVGVVAVQLAVRAGATVIGTASEENHDFLRLLGAIPTTYGAGLADRVRAIAPDGVDAAIDLNGTETIEVGLALGVAPDRIVSIAAGPKPPGGTFGANSAMARPGALHAIAEAVAAGTIRIPITTFPLDRISDAVAVLREGHTQGKIVIVL